MGQKEDAVREDQQGQAVLHAAERAAETKKGMRARGIKPGGESVFDGPGDICGSGFMPSAEQLRD